MLTGGLDTTGRMKAFGTPLPRTDPLFPVFEDAVRRPVPDETRALVVNLAYDQRVSVGRAKSFLRSAAAGGVTTPEDLRKHLTNHLDSQRFRADPEFCTCAATRVRPPPELFRLLNLDGLWIPVARQYGASGKLARTGAPWLKAAAVQPAGSWGRTLARRMAPARRVETVRDLLEALAVDQRAGNHFEPAWCAPWTEVEALVHARQVARLLTRMGIRPNHTGWWVGLRYRLPTGTHLHVPTQLEAGNNPLHFPTPPDARCGATMPVDSRVRRFIREYVHLQVPHQWEDVERAGVVAVRVKRDARPSELDAWRTAQRARIRAAFPGADGWMPDVWRI